MVWYAMVGCGTVDSSRLPIGLFLSLSCKTKDLLFYSLRALWNCPNFQLAVSRNTIGNAIF